jgi:isopenicillin N synthase-like dioxygenase
MITSKRKPYLQKSHRKFNKNRKDRLSIPYKLQKNSNKPVRQKRKAEARENKIKYS